ncbi:hypothetical protein ACJW31_07G067000 [Castanea mollissima]
MGSITGATATRPHVVCVPVPLQGHITPMLKLAKLLHHKGFHVTFVHTEYNCKRLLRSRGPNSLDGLADFHFEAIPDGLPPSDADVSQDVVSLCDSTSKNCLVPFCNLLYKLNDTSSSNVPPVTCIISDGCMSFTLDAADKFGIPDVQFWTPSWCGFLSYMHFRHLVERGLIPLKDASYLTNGYLETKIDWIQGMKNIRLKDLPNFIKTIDENDIVLKFVLHETERTLRASAIILNTFDSFEQDVLDALSSMLPRIYTIGPLSLLADQIENDNLKSINSNLWKEEPGCLEWLNSKEPNSVVYVNFGSITVITPQQLIEFAWGLANSEKPFLWIIRPDLVVGHGVEGVRGVQELYPVHGAIDVDDGNDESGTELTQGDRQVGHEIGEAPVVVQEDGELELKDEGLEEGDGGEAERDIELVTEILGVEGPTDIKILDLGVE